jgi:hypothetical protein
VDTGGGTSSYIYRDILDMVERQAERRGVSIVFEGTGDLKLSYRDVAAKVRGLGASLMLLFGKQSKHRAYRTIGFGEAGWEGRFRRPPVVAWASGPHGRYFHSYNCKPMMRHLDRFLRGRPQRPGWASGLEARLVMAIHKAPRLFDAYRKLFKRVDRLLVGKRTKLDRYTGEPEA